MDNQIPLQQVEIVYTQKRKEKMPMLGGAPPTENLGKLIFFKKKRKKNQIRSQGQPKFNQSKRVKLQTHRRRWRRDANSGGGVRARSQWQRRKRKGSYNLY